MCCAPLSTPWVCSFCSYMKQCKIIYKANFELKILLVYDIVLVSIINIGFKTASLIVCICKFNHDELTVRKREAKDLLPIVPLTVPKRMQPWNGVEASPGCSMTRDPKKQEIEKMKGISLLPRRYALSQMTVDFRIFFEAFFSTR